MMMIYLVAVVFITYGLFMSVSLLGNIGNPIRGKLLKYHHNIPDEAADFVWLEGIMIMMLAINSTVNPLIYHWKSRDFRSAFKQLLGCKMEKGEDDGTSGTASMSKSGANTKVTNINAHEKSMV